MADGRPVITQLSGRRMQLGCRHWVAWPDDFETRADGWYAAQFCPYCKRKRAVICASFSKFAESVGV